MPECVCPRGGSNGNGMEKARYKSGMLIKKAMKGHVDLLNPAMAVAEELTGIPSFETPDYSEALAQEKALVASMKKVFLMVAGHAVQTFGPEL